MNSRHAKTMADIRRTKSTIRWPQVEALFRALGATVTQGAGSRVIVTLNGRRAVFHRPHRHRFSAVRSFEASPRSLARWMIFEHKGYHGGRIELGEDGYFHGRVLGIRDVITFAGKTPEELAQAFRDSLETYLEFCAQNGEAPDKPHSGKFQVRIDPGLHRKVVAASEAENMSMNAWIARALEKEADRELG